LLFAVMLRADDDYLQWDGKRARAVVLSQRVTGQVGKGLDFRVIQTDRSINYKLRATWMTPEAIRATARMRQLASGLSVGQTRRLVEDAEAAGEIVILVEIDPREGSGVIPGDWVALLGPREQSGVEVRQVAGVNSPKLRDLAALAAVAPRDYSFELFWLVFPLKTNEGKPVFTASDREAELSVRIQNRVGKVRWPIPEHLRAAGTDGQ
jgi:hypothetical protein